LKDYKEIIDKAIDFDTQKLKLKTLKFKKINPFDTNLPFKDELFVNRVETIETLIYEVGLGKHKLYNKNIFLTGQTGTGKTYLLEKFNSILDKLELEGAKYKFRRACFEMDELYETIENEDGSSFKRYVNYKNKTYDVVIFKSGSLNQILDMIRKFQNSIIKIFVISLITWKENKLDLINYSELYMLIKLHNLTFKDILKTFDQRLKFFDIERNNIIPSESIIESASKACFNNIKLVLMIFYEAFRYMLKTNEDKLSSELIESIINSKDILNLGEKYNTLSSIRKKILLELYLNKSITSKEMAGIVDRNWANISTYMKDLSELGFLKRIKVGKSVEYKLSNISLLLIEKEYLEEE